jgi:hypothetical protein
MPIEGSQDNKGFDVINSSQIVLEARPNRVKVTFVNNSGADNIWLAKGQVAVANKGIYLAPYGSYEDIPVLTPKGPYIYKGRYEAISDNAAGSGNLSVIEESI